MRRGTRAAFWLILDLGPVLRRLSELSDAELRATIERLCLRVVGPLESGGLAR